MGKTNHPMCVEAIWIKRAHRRPLVPVSQAKLIAGYGFEGNVPNGRFRQLTLIEREVWEDVTRKAGTTAPPVSRRANVMLSGGVGLAGTRGRVLRIGTVRVEIAGETRPCERMEEVAPGLQNAMDANWGGGAYAKVLDEGEIRVGDPVEWEAP